MGCLCQKSKKEESYGAKPIENVEYSWDKRRTINVDDFIIKNLEQDEKWKIGGAINGEQVVIDNCNSSSIYILDHINTISIDDCTSCKIIIGPVKGSAFLRDCENCVCLIACGQFRIRDCRNMVIFLSCATQPIIESSSSIHFGCYQLSYPSIREHFKNAQLSIFNNTWSRIHDFTPIEGELNWKILPENTTPQNYFSCHDLSRVGLSLSVIDSAVPYTTAVKMCDRVEHCFVVFFCCEGQEEEAARILIDKIYLERVDCRLVWSRQVELSSQESCNIFQDESYARLTKHGPVIGLLFSGPCITYSCNQVIGESLQHVTVYVSDSPREQVNKFLSITDMRIAF
ncbi:protein XRP2 [Nilaparvata lugens]|uniref:protein XRP2 n=1 Tax=Nilaparvata lugens TaxID=108931 RepID=UPI000B996B2B|nr:protein XRP2 [Nilaparvata lugens]